MREPKPTQRNYLMQSNLARLLRINIERNLLGRDLCVLDCGCGKKPYLPFFEDISSLYVGIDAEKGDSVDVIGDVTKLPFRGSSFDVVLCTQVMEHVLSPEALLEQINGVLKDWGILFLSTHGVWPVHAAPYDFWRWTDLGLRRMLAKFSSVRISECGGNIAALFQIINLYLPSIPVVRPAISLLLNKMGECLDRKYRGRSADLIVNYFVVARKQS